MVHKLVAYAVAALALAALSYEGYKAYVSYESNVAAATAQAQQGGGSNTIDTSGILNELASLNNAVSNLQGFNSGGGAPTIIFPSNVPVAPSHDNNLMAQPVAQQANPLITLASSALSTPSVLSSQPLATQVAVQSLVNGVVNTNAGTITPANIPVSSNPLLSSAAASRNADIISSLQAVSAATSANPAFNMINAARASIIAERKAKLLPS